MFKNLEEFTKKPKVWSKYTAEVLWTGEHISKQMLNFHLNQDIDASSRSFAFIDKSVDWLITKAGLNDSSQIIDFGCGPGLYTTRFKERGIGTVVGLDFSKNSLDYAKSVNGQIEYHLGNYLEFDDPRKFDLITLIMCDFCALSPEQRSILLKKFKSMLAPNGMIALDVYTKKRFDKLSESITLEKNSMSNFWSEKDYWCIQSNFQYTDEMVSLDKYVIIEEDQTWPVYNWLQHFTKEMLEKELETNDLKILESYDDLCGNPLTDHDEMAFIITHKS